MPAQQRKKKKKKKKDKTADLTKKIVIILVAVTSVVAISTYILKKNKVEHYFNKEKFLVRGVDLSHHNPIIDWKEIKDRNNISFVYLKATGGVKHVDRNYPYNYKSARQNNIKTGSYHFYLFGASGEEQAKHFIRSMKYVSGDLYPAIDVEHSNDNIYSKDTAYINRVVKELQVLENSMFEYFGVHPLIYTNRDCYKLYIKDNFPQNMVWMCDLQKEPSYIDNWIIWQFSHKGELDGVVGDIDLNYFRYTHEQLSMITLP